VSSAAGSDSIVPEQLQDEPNQTKDSHQVMTAAELEDDDFLASNHALAWTDVEGIGEREPDAIQSGGVGPLNLIWARGEKLSTGIELMWGTRENADGDDGDATRVQTVVKYAFW
jgi:hypothetical protein